MGEHLEVTGQITPQPNQSGAFVAVDLTAPGGAKVPNSVVANSLGEFSYTVACDDIDQAGTWTVRCSWSGDEGLYPADSDDQILEVSRAEPRVTINATSQALKLDVPVDISGKFTPLPDCEGDLTGLSIKLNFSGPGGVSKSETVTTHDRWGHYVLQDYEGINIIGDWTVEAVFDENDAYASCRSEIMKIKVVETAGYAIIVQGKVNSEEGLASHNKSANFVYQQLKARDLLDEDINYFNYDDSQPGVDAVPTKTGIDKALTEWARDKLNTKPANLYLIFIDHGYDDVFYMHPDTMTAQELKAWLNMLRANLSPQAAEQETIIILGFCRSGSFIDDLSDIKRVIVTSAAADESSYKGPLDADGIREGEYFINEYFKSVVLGKSVKQSFQEAVVLTEAFTASESADSGNGPYFDTALQHPLLDDNGDRIGSNEVSDPSGDGSSSAELFIGVSPVNTNDPEDVRITHVTETVFLNDTQNSADFWAQVEPNSRLDTLWIEIKPAEFTPTGDGSSEQIAMDLPKAVFESYNPGLDRFEWSAQDGFSDPGTYLVFYFAKDSQTANVSPLMQSTVYKALAGNSAPNPFLLVSPQNDTTHLTALILDWEDATDPEQDPITYTVLLSRGDNAFLNPIRKEGLLYSTCIVTDEDGLQDLSTYYWKVQAVDSYGAVTESDVRFFHTNNTNPVAGWIKGHVYDSVTDTPLVGAQVTIGTTTLTTAEEGYFLGVFAPGTYSATASASGYDLPTPEDISLPEGEIISKNFALVSLTADNDEDGLPDIVENIVECLDPNDADSDDDGILDGAEDSNQDGVVDEGETDPCDVDSDGDGIQDGTESGLTMADIGEDTDTAVFQPDMDPSTTTDPLNEDSDGDGLLDGEEDSNHNGSVDPGEKDPNRFDARALTHILILLFDNQ